MSEVDVLRDEILSYATSREAMESRLEAYEDALRRLERKETLASVEHSLNTLRGLVAFLRQQVLQACEPLEKLSEEIEREVGGSLTHERRT